MGEPLGPATHAEPDQQAELSPGFRHTYWERISSTQLGVDVIDPDGHDIGTATVRRSFAGVDAGGWRPVDGEKHVLVGELDHYYFYDPRLSIAPDEADFNLWIHPDKPFAFLLDDVVKQMSAAERGALHKRKRGPGHVVECEVTPDEEYYDDRHFPTREHSTSPLIGTSVGVYGPWVRDLDGNALAEQVGGKHGGRPEIHPAEVIFWRTGTVDRIAGGHGHVRWTVVVLQDDSNRFDRRSDDDGPVPRPWSASPRRARITLALAAPRDQHVQYFINTRDGRRIFDWPGEEQRSVTRPHQGRPAITVSKRMSRRSEVKLRVSDVAADPADDDVLRCLMSFEVRVGDGDRGQEGFAEFTVEAFAQHTTPGGGVGSGGAPGAGRPGGVAGHQQGDRQEP